MGIIARFVAVAALLAGTLTGIAPPANAGMAYIPLGSANELLVVDTAKDAVVGKIRGLPAVHGLAGTPDGKYLIAGSFEGRDAKAPAPAKPSGMSGSEHAAHHKAAPAGMTKAGSDISTLSVIRTADRSIVRRIDVPGAVHHVAVSPDGGFAVVTNPGEDKISAIDLTSYKVVANVSTGPFPNYAAFSPDGKTVYVSNAGNNTVSSVDVEKWIVRWNAIVGNRPEHIVLSRDGATLYVNNVDDGTVSVIDTQERKTVKSMQIGSTLHGIDISDDGKTLFVAARGDDKLVAVDLATNQMRPLVLSPGPYHLTVIRGLGKVYVTSAGKPKIWVVDQKSLKVTGEIPIGGKGHQIVQSAGS